METIVLASQSPRRKQLLEWAEIPFEVIVKETNEAFDPVMPVAQIPIHIARNKVLAVQPGLEHRIILGADTIVVLDGKVIGKPTDRNDAVNILEGLSGARHEVVTGVVIRKGDREASFSDITEVYFHALTRKEIEFYVDKYKPYDKAGAYAIQEWIGVVGIQSISGDFYNVMGLPVSRVVRELRNF
ncbi:MAG TPA: Maf family protein [Chitinophagaceae bacterium]|nr:Maf family protein [Chitinophagaceae bacterium]